MMVVPGPPARTEEHLSGTLYSLFTGLSDAVSRGHCLPVMGRCPNGKEVVVEDATGARSLLGEVPNGVTE